MALGELETGGLFFAVFFPVMLGRSAARRWPALVAWRPAWSQRGLLLAEAGFAAWGLTLANHALGAWARPPDAGPLNFLFTGVNLPPVGGVYFSNILEGMALTYACLRAGQGTFRVALYVLPMWYGFHDGLYFLIFDLWGGFVPFLYNSMLTPFGPVYFGGFLVDIWQAFTVVLVARALWRSRSRAAWGAAAALFGAWAAAIALSWSAGTTTVAQLNTGAPQVVPNSFIALYSWGGLPYMILYTAAMYFILRPRRRA